MRALPWMFVCLMSAGTSWAGSVASTSSTPFAYSSSCFMESHFAMARSCWHQRKMPKHWVQAGMIRGFLKGEARFWPGDVEWTREAFAYAISETGGNVEDNGREFGCCGLSWVAARYAGLHWKIPMPKSNWAFKRKLKTDPEYCAFMTCACLAYFATCCDGDIPFAVAGMKFGQAAFQRLSRDMGVERIYEWPCVTSDGHIEYPMRHWRSIVRWTRCAESGLPCYECEPAMERDMKGTR